MIKRFHGVDRHKKYWSISVLDQEGVEIEFIGKCEDPKAYVGKLGSEDAVVTESGSGCFYWADRIERQGGLCFVIDPHKFKIIKDSWNKTDKNDSRNMAKALWVYLVTGQFGLPTVYKPSAVIRELRKLFSQYQMLNKQIRILKNSVQSVLVENGIALSKLEKNHLLSEKRGLEVLKSQDVTAASRMCIQMNLELLWKVAQQKKELTKEIFLASEPLKNQVELLLTIRGITPLSALAFLADVTDVKRFKSLRKMNAYLGLVPKCKDSGEKSRSGHINRESRKLTRTILTQSLIHVTDASPHFRRFYDGLKWQKGAGKARIALIRKLCGIMRRMLLNGEEFRYVKTENFERKLRKYMRDLEKTRKERKSA